MKCFVDRSIALTLDLSEDDSKALHTVIKILNDIETIMYNNNVDSLSSEEGNYSLDLRLLTDMMGTLEGIKSCERWTEEG